MNYKKALHDDSEIASDGIKIFGVSLLVWIMLGFIFLAVAGFYSSNTG